jgi:hypothetical protein
LRIRHADCVTARPDIHLPESLATLTGRFYAPVRLDFFEAFITPPQPFAEAERKASLHN